jgi:hypothetical protein
MRFKIKSNSRLGDIWRVFPPTSLLGAATRNSQNCSTPQTSCFPPNCRIHLRARFSIVLQSHSSASSPSSSKRPLCCQPFLAASKAADHRQASPSESHLHLPTMYLMYYDDEEGNRVYTLKVRVGRTTWQQARRGRRRAVTCSAQLRLASVHDR